MQDELSPYARLIDCVPEGYTAVGFVVAIEALDEDGNPVLCCRHSQGVTAWKAAGMAMSLADDMRDAMRVPAYVRDDGEDDYA